MPPNADLLRADTILVVDTGNFAVGVPTLSNDIANFATGGVTIFIADIDD